MAPLAPSVHGSRPVQRRWDICPLQASAPTVTCPQKIQSQISATRRRAPERLPLFLTLILDREREENVRTFVEEAYVRNGISRAGRCSGGRCTGGGGDVRGR